MEQILKNQGGAEIHCRLLQNNSNPKQKQLKIKSLNLDKMSRREILSWLKVSLLAKDKWYYGFCCNILN